MTRSGTRVWLAAVAVLATACEGVPQAGHHDPAAAREKTAPTAIAAARQATTAVPEFVNPTEELNNFAPDGILRWTLASGADAYEVWAYHDLGLTQLAEFSKALLSREYQFTQLVGGFTYYVKLYYRVNGVWVSVPALELKTSTHVVKPRLVNSQEELDGIHTGGTLRWTPIEGADFYEVWVYRDDGLEAFAETSGPVGISQYQLRTLEPGRTYFVQVYSRINSVFHVGGALPLTVIATSARARIVNPAEELAAFAASGLLRWTAVTGATSYEVWIFTNPNSSEYYENSGPLTTRSYGTRTLQAGGVYYAQVYALVNGQWQVGSPVKLVTAQQVSIARLTNAQEEIEAFSTAGTLSWGAVPGADAYEIWIYGNAGLGVVAESGAGSLTARSYAVRRLCTDATYYVQVYARVNGQWTTGWATRLDVTQGTSPADCVPPAPVVTLTANAVEVVSGQVVTLTWTSKFATACAASGAWSGSRNTSGSETVGPLTEKSLFVLDCTGPSGSSRAELLVTITPPPPVAWVGAYQSSQFPETDVLFDLIESDGQLSGTMRDAEGRTGTLTGSVDGFSYAFTITLTTPDCPGTYTGAGQLLVGVAEYLDFTFTGNDCAGYHADGIGAVVRQVGSVVAFGEYDPRSITASAGEVFWLSGTEAPLKRLDVATGTVEPMAWRVGSLRGISEEGQRVLWTEFQKDELGVCATRLRSFDGSKSVVTLDSRPGCAADVTTDVAVAGGTAYWAIGNSTFSGDQFKIIATTLASGASREVATTTLRISALAADAEHVYWGEELIAPPQESRLMRIPVGGGIATSLYSGLKRPRSIALAPGIVFLAEQDYADDAGQVVAVPRTGGSAEIIARTSTAPVRVASNGTTVAWVDHDSLDARPVAGGSAVTLATAIDRPTDLAFDGGRLVWTERTGIGAHGRVRAVQLSGGAVQDLVPDASAPMRLLRSASGALYWIEGYGWAQAEFSGDWGIATLSTDGIVRSYLAGLTSPNAIAADPDNVYVADGWFLKVFPRTAGAARRLATAAFTVLDVAVDGDYVYWIDDQPIAVVMRVPIAGGAAELVSSSPVGRAGSMAIAGGRVFWVAMPDRILWAPLTGGTATTLVSGLAFVTDLVADPTHVYFNEQDAGRVSRVPLTGGVPQPLMSAGGGSLSTLAVDDDYIFAIDQTTLSRAPKAGGTQVALSNGVLNDVFKAGSVTSDGQSVFWAETLLGTIKQGSR